MRISLRGHDVGRYSLDELAKRLQETGATGVQFALKKSIHDFDVTSEKLTPGFAKEIRKSLEKYNVDMTMLGCYINMAYPDDEKLADLLEWFKANIRFVRDLGCHMVGTETGALNEEYVYGPENHTEEAYQRTLSSLRVMTKEAEKFGVTIAIEGVANHVINTPEKMRRILDEIDSNNVQAIFDPYNFLTKENYLKQDELVKKVFELYGERIVLIHAKDFIIENSEVKQVPVGKGLFNYELLLSILKERKPFIDIVLEGTTPDDVEESIRYLEKIYAEV